jgi:hypothetical protein
MDNMKTGKFLIIILFITGMILMVFNIIGLFRSLRNEDLYSEVTPYKDDITIRFEEAKKLWRIGENESPKDFTARASMLVSKSMAHYWRDEGIKKYNMSVPLWENYILRIKQWVSGRKKYEFRNYKKVIERGVGLCSQPCIGLKYLLNEHGIEADLWDLQQHIVVGVTFSDHTEYTLDPDYGYVIPVDIRDLIENPSLVREAYKNHDAVYADHVTEHKQTDDIVKMYTQEGNHIYYMKKTFEDFAYIAKWVLPFLLILPFILTFLMKKKT